MKTGLFLKSLSWLLVLNVLIKPLWIFGIDRPVQNLVGHAAYGRYFALFNLTYVLLFLADAGLSNLLSQKLAADGQLPVRQMLHLKIVLLLLYLLVCLGVAAVAGMDQWIVFGWLVLVQSLGSFLMFLRSLLTARQYFKAGAVFSVLDKTLLLLLCAGPVYGLFFRISIPLFLQLQLLSLLLTTGSLLFFLVKKKAFTVGKRLPVKTIAAYLRPFAFIILLMAAHNRLDAFLLERLHPDGARQAGIYAMAYRLLDAASMVGFLTASFLVPYLAQRQAVIRQVQPVLRIARIALLIFGAALVAFVWVFAPGLQALLYHTTDAYTQTVIRLCIAALPAYYLVHVYGSALTATAHLGLFIRILLVCVVLNLLLNLWLIPVQGAVGCCVAALVSQYVCGLALWLAASRKLMVAPAAF